MSGIDGYRFRLRSRATAGKSLHPFCALAWGGGGEGAKGKEEAVGWDRVQLARKALRALLLYFFSREFLGLIPLLQRRVANLTSHGIGGLAIKARRGDDCGSKTAIGYGGSDERLKVRVKRASLWVLDFLGQRVQVIRLVGCCPVDAKASALREHGMNNHDGAAVAVEERMAIGKMAHNLARLCQHECLVLSLFQCVVDGTANVIRPREENGPLAHANAGGIGQAIFTCPRINRFEERFVGAQHVLIGKLLSSREVCERRIEAGCEGRMLQLSDNSRVLGSGDIA